MRCFSNRKFGAEFEINETQDDRNFIAAIISYASSKNNRKCEMYISDWEQSINNTYWHVKTDSSCGWEICTPVSSGSEDLAFIGTIATYLSKWHFETDERCGFHIHVDVSDFDEYQMGILFNRWIKIEKYLLKLVPKHRRNNIHCLPYHKLDWFVNISAIARIPGISPCEIWNAFCPTNFSPHNNVQKRYTLNFVNFAKFLSREKEGLSTKHCRKTLELRLPEGTLNSEDITNWIKLFVSFIEASKKCRKLGDIEFITTQKQFFKICGLNEDKNNTISPDLLETKNWIIKRENLFKN